MYSLVFGVRSTFKSMQGFGVKRQTKLSVAETISKNNRGNTFERICKKKWNASSRTCVFFPIRMLPDGSFSKNLSWGISDQGSHKKCLHFHGKTLGIWMKMKGLFIHCLAARWNENRAQNKFHWFQQFRTIDCTKFWKKLNLEGQTVFSLLSLHHYQTLWWIKSTNTINLITKHCVCRQRLSLQHQSNDQNQGETTNNFVEDTIVWKSKRLSIVENLDLTGDLSGVFCVAGFMFSMDLGAFW